VARCDAYRYGGGWVAGLGVRKPWRKRGLGLALLQRTFRLFHERGERSVGLGVDSENPTGATRLYERAGMHVESESVTFERSLA
jgi:ribosomal protein S18 acetylase RimI-like enzyme